MPLPLVLVSVLALLLRLSLGLGDATMLSDEALRRIPSAGKDMDIDDGALLAPLLIPRVPGTEGSLRAQRHFVDFFRDHLPDWTLSWQNSTSKTPATGDKDIPFANLIFRRDPPGVKVGDVSRLTLVAHYDSKFEPAGFIGAIDSAAPCAMLMHVARSIDDALTAKWDAAQKEGGADDGLEEAQGVQILFLDGEEAFVTWTEDDSLYGSRSLAEEWEAEAHPAMSSYRTPLDSISLFVLLDLLGSANPRIPSYFLPTHWAYRNMASLEKRMRALGVLETKPALPFLSDSDKQPNRFSRGYIDDDHRPFMARGVDVLHIIPSPFPDVWHEMTDDGEHLHMPTVRDWAMITTAFVVDWMGIQDYMPKPGATKRKRTETVSPTSRKTEL